MIVFVIPWFVNVIYPDLFFMFCKVAIDLMIEFCYEWMVGVGVLRSFQFCVLEKVCCGIGLLRLFMLPRGIYSLSACIIVSVINLVSKWKLSEGV